MIPREQLSPSASSHMGLSDSQRDEWLNVTPEYLGAMYDRFEVSRATIDDAFALFEKDSKAGAPSAASVSFAPHAALPASELFVTAAPTASAEPARGVAAISAPRVRLRGEIPPYDDGLADPLAGDADRPQRFLLVALIAVLGVAAIAGATVVYLRTDAARFAGAIVGADANRAALARARAFAARGDHAAAVAVLRETLRSNPEDAELHGELGANLRWLSRWREAADAYREASRLDPQNARWHSELGRALVWTGERDEAVRRHLRAIELEPNAPRWHDDYGVTLRWLGNSKEAEAEFRRAAQLEPGNPEYLEHLEDALSAPEVAPLDMRPADGAR